MHSRSTTVRVRFALRFLLPAVIAVSGAPLFLASPAASANSHVVTPSTWSGQTVPAGPFPNTSTTYQGISCVGPAFCMAVGTSGDIIGLETSVSATWNGTVWSTAGRFAMPAGTQTALNSVSCATPTWCVAVGQKIVNTIGTALVEVWNGRSWAVSPIPSPGSTNSYLRGVSCPATTFCATVGSSDIGQSSAPLAYFWNGSWAKLSLPVIPGSSNYLSGVSCVGMSCQAIGVQALGPLALGWDGTKWTVESPPAGTPPSESSFDAVSCSSANACDAVGTQNEALKQQNLVERWNGSAWTVQSVPATPTSNHFTGIDCFGPTSCVAVGQSLNTKDTGANNSVYTWNGANWISQSVAPASTTTYDSLYAVTCVPDDLCQSVGDVGVGFSSTPEILSSTIYRPGYDEVASDGGLFAFGSPFFGSMGGKPLNTPVVSMTMTPDGGGTWEVASDGGLFAFGDAAFYGSMGGKPLNAPIVGMVPTLDGLGYWEVASDGGLFAFGDAAFYGSMGGKPLNAPIVGIAVTPDGLGYFEVASDGGLFAFGDATFLGSMGGQPLNKPIVGMAVTPKDGYYEVASDGGFFAFGGVAKAPFYGSMGGQPLNAPIVGMSLTPTGGYYEVATDGGLFAFGGSARAPFLGSMGGQPLNQPIVGMAN